jgi:hypothetical protein
VRVATSVRQFATPTPNPTPQGGGEYTECAAPGLRQTFRGTHFGVQPVDAGEGCAHEQDAGLTSAHSRPEPARVATTRTQLPVRSRLCNLV